MGVNGKMPWFHKKSHWELWHTQWLTVLICQSLFETADSVRLRIKYRSLFSIVNTYFWFSFQVLKSLLLRSPASIAAVALSSVLRYFRKSGAIFIVIGIFFESPIGLRPAPFLAPPLFSLFMFTPILWLVEIQFRAIANSKHWKALPPLPKI